MLRIYTIVKFYNRGGPEYRSKSLIEIEAMLNRVIHVSLQQGTVGRVINVQRVCHSLNKGYHCWSEEDQKIPYLYHPVIFGVDYRRTPNDGW